MILGRSEETERSHAVSPTPPPSPPPSLPTTLKYGEEKIFSEKSFSWGEAFLDKFMQGIFKSCSLVCRLGRGELV